MLFFLQMELILDLLDKFAIAIKDQVFPFDFGFKSNDSLCICNLSCLFYRLSFIVSLDVFDDFFVN